MRTGRKIATEDFGSERLVSAPVHLDSVVAKDDIDEFFFHLLGHSLVRFIEGKILPFFRVTGHMRETRVELIDTRTEGIAAKVHGGTRRGTAGRVAVGVDKGGAFANEAVSLRRFDVAKLTVILSGDDFVEGSDRVVAVIVCDNPENVRLLFFRCEEAAA